MNKYEISLWEDFQSANGLDERKICTIGSDKMKFWTRAREPKMVENINGTHTFSFKMFYNYIDEITGETVLNPFRPYLINERKVKVLWQDNWYDLIIKNIDEDSSGNSAVYTCKDAFITELSKNGYNIELTSDLQNNSGTASDLVERVLDGSGWRFDSEGSNKIYQYLEQPVYEVIVGALSATKISPNSDSSIVSIPNGAKILILKSYIDQVLSTNETNIELHFIYTAGGSYQTDYGEMLVINGDEYYINTSARKVSNGVQVQINNNQITLNTVSSNYRAKGLVQSQKSVYDPLFERYVNVYKDKSSGNKVYGFQTTEFSKPTTVINLIANSSNFRNTSGWIGEGLTWEVYPSDWSSIQDLTDYSVTGYLKVPSGSIYNNGISANLNLLQPTTSEIKNGETGGFHVGDKFIFRAKVKSDLSSGYIKDNFEFQICEFNNDYSKKGNSYFSSVRINPNSDWYEAELTCTSSCPSTELEKLGFFFINKTQSDLYIEDIQFFKDVQGSEDVINYYTKSQPQLTLNINEANGNTYSFYKDSEVETLIYLIGIPDGYTVEPGTGNGSEYWPLNESIRSKANQNGTTTYSVINQQDNIISTFTVEVVQESYQSDYIETTKTYIAPGEINLQGVASVVYKYYNANQEKGILPEEVDFLYVGEEESSDFEPITTYEKITTIEAKGSNRFNILQSVAENFQCWIRFTVNHDNNGKISLDADGLPEKYITLVSDLGVDLGWSFIYGIDLKAIKRKIISEDIVTKTIVLDNNNEFGKNGFCSIARSPLNYARENFILNFDYYVKAGLLDKDEVEADLYGSFGYLTKLNDWNTQYIESVDTLVQKKMELDKQSSELEVLTKRNKSIAETITSNESDVMKLLNIDSFAAAAEYLEENPSNKKINDLMTAIGQSRKEQKQINDQLEKLEGSVNNLQTYVTNQEAALQAIISTIKNLHNEFFKKYSRYIQEGTWQSEDYVDDNKYYLDAMEVAHTSAFPRVQYDISVIRVNALEEFSSKTFSVGDTCYIQDKDFFNFVTEDGNPYKLQIVISEITSYFDNPEKDVIKVQNYKTQFEDLFQRITATTQSLQYSQGSYAKAASAFNSNGDLKFNLLQETFDNNASIVMNASNQDIIWDSTGITIKDSTNSAQLLRIMSGGLFVSNDGGLTWKNAVRGDGISTDVLTAGRINTGEIFILNDDSPTFRWDSNGINAYSWAKDDNDNTVTNFNKYVRFDQYGLYGYDGNEDPTSLDDIKNNALFGLTWDGFFMQSTDGDGAVIIDSNDEQGNVIKCIDSNDNITFALNKDGTASFTGAIHATSLILDEDAEEVITALIPESITPDLSDYVTFQDFEDLSGELKGNYVAVDTVYTNGTDRYILSAEGSLQAQNAFIAGTVVADHGIIGGWKINPPSVIEANRRVDQGNSSYPNGALYFGADGSIGQNGTIALIPEGQTSSTAIAGSDAKQDWRLIIGSRFAVDSNGNVYATNGHFSGNISASYLELTGQAETAINGMIDAKIITNNDMIARTYVTDSPTNGYIKVNQSYGDTVFSYDVSTDNLLTANNIVVNGTVYATDGSFAGEVKASSGNIGGWKIATDSSKALYYSQLITTGITSPGYQAYAESLDGMVYKFFKTEESTILLTIRNLPEGYVLNPPSNPEGSDKSSTDSIRSIANQVGSTVYEVENQSGNILATFTITVIEKTYKISPILSPLDLVNNLSIANSPSQKNWRLVVGNNFGVDSTGNLYASNGHFSGDISSGTINAGEVVFQAYQNTTQGGGFKCATGNDGNSNTYGAMMYGGTAGTNYFIATNAGVRMTATANSEIYCISSEARIKSTNVYVNGKSFVTNTGAFTGSDRNKKYDISYEFNKYEDFYKSLKPSFFKLKDGTSNRYHIGFIAQDVQSALLDNNLTTQDFAGFGIITSDNEPEYQALRYEEFISLNTYMIQKLYARIEELEQEIETLKQ